MTLAIVQAHPDKDKGYELDHLRPEINYRPGWGKRSASFRDAAAGRLDLPYGYGVRGTLDFFPAADSANAPTLIFIHGGYWHKGDKSFYSFVAEPYVAQGISCVLLNYDFCPSVRITDIGAQVQAAVEWVWRNSDDLGISPNKLHISGHSAGGHLAAMMMTTDWSAYKQDLPVDLLKSAIVLSGLFDLEPLLDASVNDALRMDASEAVSQSPVNRCLPTSAPQLVACGQLESDEFHRQSDLYLSRFAEPGRSLERYSVESCNHFDVVDELAGADRPLFQKALSLIQGAT